MEIKLQATDRLRVSTGTSNRTFVDIETKSEQHLLTSFYSFHLQQLLEKDGYLYMLTWENKIQYDEHDFGFLSDANLIWTNINFKHSYQNI